MWIINKIIFKLSYLKARQSRTNKETSNKDSLWVTSIGVSS